MTTLYLPSLFSQDHATVEGDPHHHLFRVRRLQAGDALRVVDGRGSARSATIESVTRTEARLAMGEAVPSNEPALAVELYVAAPKPERAAWLVEKATELGVVAIHFIEADREARSFSAGQIQRLTRVAISAVEQCGRSLLPAVGNAGDLREVVSRTRESGATVVVLEASGGPERPTVGGGRPTALLVGPEGGWSAEERALFEKYSLVRWSLGSTVLRVETAAVVAAGIVLAG